MKEEILKQLEVFNDPNFIFKEEEHEYEMFGEKFTSVTRFIEQFHEKFDSDYWSKRKADKEGVEQQVILDRWQDINDHSNMIGTFTHNWIEDYFNKKYRELPTDPLLIDRINKFNLIYSKELHKLEPVKFEVKIFSKIWKIAGTIDALFLYKDKLYIIDYKTNKKFTTDKDVKFKKYLLKPFEKYYETHLNEYSIQLSLYSLILEQYEINVNGMYLVYIPANDNPSIHKCVNMREELLSILN